MALFGLASRMTPLLCATSLLMCRYGTLWQFVTKTGFDTLHTKLFSHRTTVSICTLNSKDQEILSVIATAIVAHRRTE
jgi:hypothetical protein